MIRKLPLIMAGVLMFSSFTACSQKASENQKSVSSTLKTKNESFNKTGFPIVNTPITVTCLYPREVKHGDFEKMWFFDELSKKTNINIKIMPVEKAGWTEKKNLAFASGDLPDIFLSGLTSSDENIYGPQSLLVNLSPLMKDYGPEISGLFNKYQNVKKSMTFTDGSIYCLPTIIDYTRDLASIRPFINQKWLDNLGLKMPSTLDELYTVLKAFKDGDPNKNGNKDEIPMTGRYAANKTNLIVLSALGFVDADHDVIDGKYVYVRTQPAYKEYLSYMNKLYKEGILDKEYFTQTNEQFLAKRAANRIGLTADGSVISDTKGNDYMELKMLKPLTSSINSKPTWDMSSEYNRWGTFAITSKCKYPEAMMRMADFLYTQEGSMMVRCGPEAGKWSGNGGYEKVKIDGVETGNFKYDGFDTYYNFRLANTIINAPFYNNTYIGDFLTYNDQKQAWLTQKANESGILKIAREGYPDVKYTQEEQDRVSSFVDLNNYAVKAEAQFITGDLPITEWDNYLKNMSKLGVEEMIKIRQQAYERWNTSGKK